MIIDLISDIKLEQESGNQIILGIGANEILKPDETPVKIHNITFLKRKCGLTDLYKFQYEEIRDTSIKRDIK